MKTQTRTQPKHLNPESDSNASPQMSPISISRTPEVRRSRKRALCEISNSSPIDASPDMTTPLKKRFLPDRWYVGSISE